MGYLVIENVENSGPIKEIAISGCKTIYLDVEQGDKSEPIQLDAGHYTVTVTINQPMGKTKEVKEPFIIVEGKTETVVPIGLPPKKMPVPVPKMLSANAKE